MPRRQSLKLAATVILAAGACVLWLLISRDTTGTRASTTLNIEDRRVVLGPRVARVDGREVPARESLVEVEQGYELTWHFSTRPSGSGALSVSWSVHNAQGEPQSLAALGLELHEATWVDARGSRWPVERRISGAKIELSVPRAVLDASAFPAVLDPLLTAKVDVGPRVFGFLDVTARSMTDSTGIVFSLGQAADETICLTHLANGTRLSRRTLSYSPSFATMQAANGRVLIEFQPLGFQSVFVELDSMCQETGLTYALTTGFSGQLNVIDGGYAYLTSHYPLDGGAIELLLYRFDRDAGIAGPFLPPVPASWFGMASNGSRLAIGSMVGVGDTNVYGVWMDPFTGVASSPVATFPKTLLSQAVPRVAALPSQMLIDYEGGRRISSTGVLLDLSPRPSIGDLTTHNGRYVGVSGYAVQYMNDDGGVSGPLTLYSSGSGVSILPFGGPVPMVLASPSQVRPFAQQVDSAFAVASAPYFLFDTWNSHDVISSTVAQPNIWVGWIDNMVSPPQYLVRRFDRDGNPETPPLPARTDVESYQFVSLAGFRDGRVAVLHRSYNDWYVVTPLADGGATSVRFTGGVPNARYGTASSPLHAFFIDGTTGPGFPGNAEVRATRLRVDGTRAEATAPLVASFGTQSPRVAARGADDGLWALVQYDRNIGLPDGGFDTIDRTSIHFLPDDAGTTRLILTDGGLPDARAVDVAVRQQDLCAYYASVTAVQEQCVHRDGGVFSDRTVAFSSTVSNVSITHDGERLHVLACMLDAGSRWGALEADGGAWFADFAEPCVRLLAIGPERLADVSRQIVRLDGGAAYRGVIDVYVHRAPGRSCVDDRECITGRCIDAVCCTSACGTGLSDDCLACSIAAGAAVDGVCSVISSAMTCRASSGGV